jgi:hypothetical protein
MAISRDGALLVSTGTGPVVRLWDPSWWDRPSSDWTEAGCRLVGRDLTQAEWDQFAGGLPYQRTCTAPPACAGSPRVGR